MASDTVVSLSDSADVYYNRDGTVAIHIQPRIDQSSSWHCFVCNGMFHPFNRSTSCGCCRAYVCSKCTHSHPLVSKPVCDVCYSLRVPEAAGLHECPWWHGRVDRHEAERRMNVKDKLPGDFMIRESENRDGVLVLTARDGLETIHMKLLGKPGAWYMPGARKQTCRTIQALADTLTKNEELAILERPLVLVTPHSPGTPCPSCHCPVVNNPGTSFCPCGARLRSAPKDVKIFEMQGHLAHTLDQDEDA